MPTLDSPPANAVKKNRGKISDGRSSAGFVNALWMLRAGSGEAVQGLFPVFFVFLFLSSQALPRPLIEQDWFRTVATWNPVSYMLEGIRSVVITGWDRVALERGFAIAIALCVIGILGASRALRTRLVRT